MSNRSKFVQRGPKNTFFSAPIFMAVFQGQTRFLPFQVIPFSGKKKKKLGYKNRNRTRTMGDKKKIHHDAQIHKPVKHFDTESTETNSPITCNFPSGNNYKQRIKTFEPSQTQSKPSIFFTNTTNIATIKSANHQPKTIIHNPSQNNRIWTLKPQSRKFKSKQKRIIPSKS